MTDHETFKRKPMKDLKPVELCALAVLDCENLRDLIRSDEDIHPEILRKAMSVHLGITRSLAHTLMQLLEKQGKKSGSSR